MWNRRMALAGRDLTIRLMTIAILIGWSYPLILLVDRPVEAALALGTGLVVGLVLRHSRRLPVAMAAVVIAVIALAALVELSFDLRGSFVVDAVLQVVNVWGPGIMGASLGLVAKQISDQMFSRQCQR